MKVNRECYFYHEEQDMGANIPTCNYYFRLGYCPCVNCEYYANRMSDLIRRQAAIELIHSLYPSEPIMRMNRKRWKKKYKPYIEAEKALEMLPSALPEPKEIRRHFCKE